MVGVDGLEPSRCCHQWFLRPPCLPIPAHAQIKINYKFFFHWKKFNFKSIKNKNTKINIKLNGAYGLVQQIKIKNSVNFKYILTMFEILKFKDCIRKHIEGITTKRL